MRKVRAALVTAFQTVTLPVATSQIIYENRTRPKGNGTYIQFHFVPNPPVPITLGAGGLDEMTGFVQIDYCTVMDTGEGEANSVAAACRDVFIAGKQLIFEGQVVRVLSCGRSNGRVIDGWFRVPITIQWTARLVRGTL